MRAEAKEERLQRGRQRKEEAERENQAKGVAARGVQEESAVGEALSQPVPESLRPSSPLLPSAPQRLVRTESIRINERRLSCT